VAALFVLLLHKISIFRVEAGIIELEILNSLSPRPQMLKSIPHFVSTLCNVTARSHFKIPISPNSDVAYPQLGWSMPRRPHLCSLPYTYLPLSDPHLILADLFNAVGYNQSTPASWSALSCSHRISCPELTAGRWMILKCELGLW
jgi:hypothetical protein